MSDNDWTPVTEGLPEKCGDYLTTLELPNGEYVSYWSYFREDRLWEAIYNYKVVAWMPRPEPWRGEGA